MRIVNKSIEVAKNNNKINYNLVELNNTKIKNLTMMKIIIIITVIKKIINLIVLK